MPSITATPGRCTVSASRAGPSWTSPASPHQQLKDLAKRWVRWRLSTGLSLQSGGLLPLRVLTRLAAFLQARGITGADGISRAVLEDYLADLHAAMAGRQVHGAQVSALGLFLTAIRQHGWAPDLPADAMLFPGDQPPRIEAAAPGTGRARDGPGRTAQQPRPAGELRLPADHAYPDPLRTAHLRCLKLPFDCTVTDGTGAPYLRYRNNKMKREALVPLDDELLELIRGQQQRVLERCPSGIVLFPPPGQEPRTERNR